MKAERIVFGLALLLAGAVWLLANLGLIDTIKAGELWRYWPLLLVIWGILMLTGKESGFGGCLLALLILGLVFGGVFTVFLPSHRGPVAETHNFLLAPVEGTAAIELNLIQHAGEFLLESHAFDSYLNATFQDVSGPAVNKEKVGEKAIINVADSEKTLALNKRLSRWHLSVPENMPLAINMRSGATRAELNLTRLDVSNLSIKAGAGEIIIHLGSSDISALVESGAAGITIYVPDDTGIRLQASGGLLSVKSESEHVVRVGEHRYESFNIHEKQAVAEIQVVAGTGSVTIKRTKQAKKEILPST